MSMINVQLPPSLQRWVDDQVASGFYHNAEEVISAAVRLAERESREYEARLRDLRAAIQEGLDSGEPRTLDMDALIRQARTEYAPSAGQH
jgi:antitoxin ParD1/3/4